MCKKAMLIDCHYWSHINKVFVQEISPMGVEGVMCRWVMMMGHGTEMTKKWYKTGLLEEVKPNQLEAASEYLNRTAQELVAKAEGFTSGSAEHTRWDTICAIALPVARMLFDKQQTPDPKFLVEDVSKFFDENKGLHEACNSYICQDGDQQLQELYIKHYDTRGTISSIPS